MMTLKQALKEQYHGGLAMLAQCIERCPDEVWLSGDRPREFWRIAFHAAFFAHLYLGQDEQAFQVWPGLRKSISCSLFIEPDELSFPDQRDPVDHYGREELSDYVRYIDALIDATVDALDLDAEATGFPWYPGMGKLSHEIMNLRHLQGHIGQLSERLMACGVDVGWVAKR